MSEESDWTLYYSEEGYPYYFNAKTGESQWAEYDTTADYSSTTYTNSPLKQINEGSDEDEEESEEDDDSDEDTESGSEEESDDEESQTSAVDRILEAKFKAFLRTPEGMAAMEAEQARISKALDKKERKRNVEKEKDYVKSLQNPKKQDDAKPVATQSSLLGGLFTYVESAAAMFSAKKAPVATSNKQSKKVKIQSSSSTTDDYGRQTVHRKPHSTANTSTSSSAPPSNDDNMESGEGNESRTVRSGSNSSLSSSDHGSVSSDDSDIVTVNAPFMSEFANYLTWTSIQNNYVTPINNYLTEHNVYDTTSSVASNVGTTTVNVLGTITSVTITVTQQGLYYTGVGLMNAFSMLYTQVNPLLLNFMRTVVDTNSPATPRLNNNADESEVDPEDGTPKPQKKSKSKLKSKSESSSSAPTSAREPTRDPQPLSNRGTPTSSRGPPLSSRGPAGGLTPHAPTTPRTPRLPVGYSGGILPTPRVEGVSTPLPPTPNVTWKVYVEEDTPSKDTVVTVDYNDEEEQEEVDASESVANVSFVSESATPLMGEVYSAPPTPGDGLIFHANPIRMAKTDPAAAVVVASSETSVTESGSDVVDNSVSDSAEGKASDVVKKLEEEFSSTEKELESAPVELTEIALSEEETAVAAVDEAN